MTFWYRIGEQTYTWLSLIYGFGQTSLLKCSPTLRLTSNRAISALIGNVGPGVNMIGLSFNMAATNHTRFKNGRTLNIYEMNVIYVTKRISLHGQINKLAF